MTDVTPKLVEVCMHHWRRGKNTAEIAAHVKVPEHDVERAVNIGIQQRMSLPRLTGRQDDQ